MLPGILPSPETSQFEDVDFILYLVELASFLHFCGTRDQPIHRHCSKFSTSSLVSFLICVVLVLHLLLIGCCGTEEGTGNFVVQRQYRA